MRTRLSSAVLAGTLLLAAAGSGAAITDNTYWYCSNHETLKVTGSPKSTVDSEGVTLNFDGVGGVQVYIPDADEFYDGTTAAKGKTGFLVTPDAAAVEDLRLYVAGRVQDLTGAEAVDITTFNFKIKGKVKDGVLRAVLKAKGKGSLTLGGRTRKGSGKLTQVLVSLPPV